MYASYQCVKLLNSKEVDIHKPSNKGKTVLHAAAKNGHIECVKFLICIGVSAEAMTLDGITALGMAAGHGHLDVVKYLEYKKCSLVNGGNENNALKLSCKNGHVSVIEYLLSYESVKCYKYSFMHYPMIQAINSRKSGAVKALLNYSEYSEVKDELNRNILHIACANSTPEIAIIILTKFPYLYTKDGNGDSPFITALRKHCFSICDKILEARQIEDISSYKFIYDDSEVFNYLLNKHIIASPVLVERSVSVEKHNPLKSINKGFVGSSANEFKKLPKVEILPDNPKSHNYYSNISSRLQKEFGNTYSPLVQGNMKDTDILLKEVQTKFLSLLSTSRLTAHPIFVTTPAKIQKKKLLDILKRKASRPHIAK